MSDVWDSTYKRLLKGQPKNTWIPYLVQDYELCVVHTSVPHGMLSLGWDGPYKSIFVTGCSSKHPAYSSLMKAAQILADQFNKDFPEGLPSFSEDEEDDRV